MIRTPFIYSLAAASILAFSGLVQAGSKNPQVLMKTSMGDIQLELFPDKAPKSVANFLSYVKKGFYDNTIFHRVIKNFMIQGGGFNKDLNEFETDPPIVNEAGNGLTNDRGTIAYARTNVVNSATSQFFINHKDNTFLNHRNEQPDGFGYAVFGKVVKGMDIVDKIAVVQTGNKNGMGDVPVTPVMILSATVVETAKK
jgi:cyclophilin family peptidyl-prolyl cis-trans isomerase